jgi:flagellar motor switch protein FliN/FliY
MTKPGMDDLGPEPEVGEAPDPVQAKASDPLPSEDEPGRGRQARSGAFLGVPIEVSILVGKARPLVSELVELRRDSVLTLDSSIDDPVELYIGDRLIARGELQEIGEDTGRLGVRLTEVADFSNEL